MHEIWRQRIIPVALSCIDIIDTINYWVPRTRQQAGRQAPTCSSDITSGCWEYWRHGVHHAWCTCIVNVRSLPSSLIHAGLHNANWIAGDSNDVWHIEAHHWPLFTWSAAMHTFQGHTLIHANSCESFTWCMMMLCLVLLFGCKDLGCGNIQRSVYWCSPAYWCSPLVQWISMVILRWHQ